MARILFQGLTPETLPSSEDRETLTSCLRLKRRDQWLAATTLGSLQIFATYRMRSAKGWLSIPSNKMFTQVAMSFCWLFSVNYVSERGMEMTIKRCGALPPTSALGNEVRVLLAELEGPEGPAWESIGSRWFRESIFSAGGQAAWDQTDEDATEDWDEEKDGTNDTPKEKKHPQFLLKPRIWVRTRDGKVGEAPLIRSRQELMRRGMDVAMDEQKKNAIERMEREERKYGLDDEEGLKKSVKAKVDEGRRRSRGLNSPRTREDDYYDNEEDEGRSTEEEYEPPRYAPERDVPFDFGAYAKESEIDSQSQGYDDYGFDDMNDQKETKEELAPSQKRAIERAKRRRGAWEKRNEIRESRGRSM